MPVLISIGCLLAIASIGLYRLASRRRATKEDLEWLDGFSLEDYRVMERLLLPADFRFLAAWRKRSPRLTRNFRHQRRRILRQYVRDLQRDFDRIQAVARLKAASSPHESGEMSLLLLQSSLFFTACRLLLAGALLLHAMGAISDVNVRPMISPVEVLLLYTRQRPSLTTV